MASKGMVIDVNVVVFGATGGMGIELVRRALGRGHSVTAFVRDPAPLASHGDGLTIVTGDARSPADVARAVRGQEAAVTSSGLDWTIVRPSGLVNTPGTGVYDVGQSISGEYKQNHGIDGRYDA